jgi:hypothetical protein
MTKPTASGPDFDTDGADDYPRNQVSKGTAEDVAVAEELSIGRPAASGKMAPHSGPAKSPPTLGDGKPSIRGH